MTMRRNIVHFIRGEAGAAHEALTKDLAERFGVFPLHEMFPPHLTLKRGFELNETGIENLFSILDTFAAFHRQSDYKLHGFGHFEEDVIYMDVDASKEMVSTCSELITALHTIPDMEFHEYDDIEDDFHASVVMGRLKAFEYETVWKYLSSMEQPHFDMKFDNFAVMKKDGEKWIVDRLWELSP